MQVDPLQTQKTNTAPSSSQQSFARVACIAVLATFILASLAGAITATIFHRIIVATACFSSSLIGSVVLSIVLFKRYFKNAEDLQQDASQIALKQAPTVPCDKDGSDHESIDGRSNIGDSQQDVLQQPKASTASPEPRSPLQVPNLNHDGVDGSSDVQGAKVQELAEKSPIPTITQVRNSQLLDAFAVLSGSKTPLATPLKGGITRNLAILTSRAIRESNPRDSIQQVAFEEPAITQLIDTTDANVV